MTTTTRPQATFRRYAAVDLTDGAVILFSSRLDDTLSFVRRSNDARVDDAALMIPVKLVPLNLLDAFLVDCGDRNVNAWMIDSGYTFDHAGRCWRDEDGRDNGSPEDVIGGAIESVLADPSNRDEYPLTFAVHDQEK